MPEIHEVPLKIKVTLICGDREFDSIEEFSKAFADGIEGALMVHVEIMKEVNAKYSGE